MHKDSFVYIKTEVKDTGVGISKQILSKIGSMFWQEEGNNFSNGVGLGLSTSKLLAEAIGGRLQIKSEPNKGTTVTFCVLASLKSDTIKFQQSSQFEMGNLLPVASFATAADNPLAHLQKLLLC